MPLGALVSHTLSPSHGLEIDTEEEETDSEETDSKGAHSKEADSKEADSNEVDSKDIEEEDLNLTNANRLLGWDKGALYGEGDTVLEALEELE